VAQGGTLRSRLKRALHAEAYTVDATGDLEEAAHLARSYGYDAAILQRWVLGTDCPVLYRALRAAGGAQRFLRWPRLVTGRKGCRLLMRGLTIVLGRVSRSGNCWPG